MTPEQEFRDRLVVPKEKRTEQLFFCPVGLVGVGKTTITKPISEALGLVRISSDEVREILKRQNADPKLLKEIIFHVAEEYANEGFSLAFDMDCGNPETKHYVELLAEKLHARVVFVHVIAPEEFIFAKFRAHPPSWLADNPETMIQNYHSQKRRREQENMSFDFFFTFDTSRADLQEQIKEFLYSVTMI